MQLSASFIEDCRAIRQRNPLIHNITNYVAMNFTANALLATGASPIMSKEPAEVADIVAGCDALVINIGCVEESFLDAARIAAYSAARCHKPWVLDPAGAGINSFRRDACSELLELHPTVVRGNASEIVALSGGGCLQRGVDSNDVPASERLESAVKIADKYGSVVAVGGATDLVCTSGKNVSVAGGCPIMSKVTAMGCTASALTAAFLAVNPDSFEAVIHALALMKASGENAGRISAGPGSFAMNFLDALYRYE